MLAGRRGWSAAWGGAIVAAIGASYLLLEVGTGGHFAHWVFQWTAGHGVDFGDGLERATRAILTRGPLLVVIVIASRVFQPRSRWTLSLVAALCLAVLGMSKSGGRENHLLPAAFIGAVIAARWVGQTWRHTSPTRERGWFGILSPSLARRATVGDPDEPREQSVSVRGGWVWLAVAGLVLAVWPGLPTGRDFRWLRQRAEDVDDWVAAVERIDGHVAVSHHLLLARRAGAECFFSDLILKFRGLEVPRLARERIASQEFDYLVLCADPRESATPGWNELIAENYREVGELEFRNRSDVLPRRVFVARRLPSPNPLPAAGRGSHDADGARRLWRQRTANRRHARLLRSKSAP